MARIAARIAEADADDRTRPRACARSPWSLLVLGRRRRASAEVRACKVGLAYGVGGPGDHGFNDSALAGLNRAATELRGSISSVRGADRAAPTRREEDQYQRLSLLCEAGYNPVIAVGFTYAGTDPADGPLARAVEGLPEDPLRDRRRRHVSAPERGEPGLRRPAGLLPDRRGRGEQDDDRHDRVRRRLRHPADQPVPRRVRGRREGGPTRTSRSITGYVVRRSERLRLHRHRRGSDRGRRRPLRGGRRRRVPGGRRLRYRRLPGGDRRPAARRSVSTQTSTTRWTPSLRPVILTSMVKRVDVAVFDFIARRAPDRFTPRRPALRPRRQRPDIRDIGWVRLTT